MLIHALGKTLQYKCLGFLTLSTVLQHIYLSDTRCSGDNQLPRTSLGMYRQIQTKSTLNNVTTTRSLERTENLSYSF